jgi:hypothetical protein
MKEKEEKRGIIPTMAPLSVTTLIHTQLTYPSSKNKEKEKENTKKKKVLLPLTMAIQVHTHQTYFKKNSQTHGAITH